MGLFDDYDDSVGTESRPPDFKPGLYLVLVDLCDPDCKTMEDQPFLRISCTILKVVRDGGDSSRIGSECSVALFRRKKFKFFERDTKRWLRAALNLSREEMDEWKKPKIAKWYQDRELEGRIMEVKAVEVPSEEERDYPIINVLPQRALTKDEAKAEIDMATLKRFCKNGFKAA